MLSISRFMTGSMIARQIRMERQADKTTTFMLVEGGDDIKRFKSFVDQTKCVQVNCWGKENAVTAIEALSKSSPPGILAVVDADFGRITGNLPKDSRIICSNSHDFDLDWASLDLIEIYLNEVGNAEKIAAAGGAVAIVQRVKEGLKPISSARLLNDMGHIRKVSHLNAADYFSNFEVDVDRYITALLGQNADKSMRDNAIRLIKHIERQTHDIEQLTNGHDFYSALGAALRTEIGERKEAQTYGGECEMHIRLMFTADNFKQTSLYHALLMWERKNQPFQILRANLRPLPESAVAA